MKDTNVQSGKNFGYTFDDHGVQEIRHNERSLIEPKLTIFSRLMLALAYSFDVRVTLNGACPFTHLVYGV